MRAGAQLIEGVEREILQRGTDELAASSSEPDRSRTASPERVGHPKVIGPFGDLIG